MASKLPDKKTEFEGGGVSWRWWLVVGGHYVGGTRDDDAEVGAFQFTLEAFAGITGFEEEAAPPDLDEKGLVFKEGFDGPGDRESFEGGNDQDANAFAGGWNQVVAFEQATGEFLRKPTVNFGVFAAN